MRDLISKGLLTAAAATSVLSLGGGHAFASDAQGTAAGSPGVLSGNNVQVPVDIPVNACGNSVDVVALLNPAFGNTCANVTAPHGQYERAHRDATAQSPARRDAAGNRAAPSSGRHAAPAPLPAPAHKPMPRPGQTVPSQGAPMGTPQSATPAAPAHTAAAQHRPAGATAGGQSVQAGSGSEASGTAQNSPGLLSGNLAQVPLDIPVNACGDTIDVIGLLNPAFGNTCESQSVPAPPYHHPPHRTQPPAPQHHTPPAPGRHRGPPDVPGRTSSYVP
ncbi:chaplin, partial [Streptomyces sp. 8L]|uniref:chaplin n=1 Tax=Streptomyces sp. 8L TaxID=2877242 RepID=UPI001CD673E9